MNLNSATAPARDTDFWKTINGQSPVLLNQVLASFIEAEGNEKYSVVGCSTVLLGGKPKFIAPHLAEILAKSGQKFDLYA